MSIWLYFALSSIMNSSTLRAEVCSRSAPSGRPWFFAILIFCLQALDVSELDFAASRQIGCGFIFWEISNFHILSCAHFYSSFIHTNLHNAVHLTILSLYINNIFEMTSKSAENKKLASSIQASFYVIIKQMTSLIIFNI